MLAIQLLAIRSRLMSMDYGIRHARCDSGKCVRHSMHSECAWVLLRPVAVLWSSAGVHPACVFDV